MFFEIEIEIEIEIERKNNGLFKVDSILPFVEWTNSAIRNPVATYSADRSKY